MSMRRKITDTLLKWKQFDKAECALLIDGARRIGKSFIVEEFAKAEFPAYTVINFKYVGTDVQGWRICPPPFSLSTECVRGGRPPRRAVTAAWRAVLRTAWRAA